MAEPPGPPALLRLRPAPLGPDENRTAFEELRRRGPAEGLQQTWLHECRAILVRGLSAAVEASDPARIAYWRSAQGRLQRELDTEAEARRAVTAAQIDVTLQHLDALLPSIRARVALRPGMRWAPVMDDGETVLGWRLGHQFFPSVGAAREWVARLGMVSLPWGAPAGGQRR